MMAWRIGVLGLAAYGLLVLLVYFSQRRLIYFPTHDAPMSRLDPWVVDDEVIGFSRAVPNPSEVWLMLSGNGGQAAYRDYVLGRLRQDASLFVLEYPGFGERSGRPSRTAIDAAAREAFAELRRSHPGVPLGVLGESLGSGPACALAREAEPPDKIVLVVPFDRLTEVAARHFWFLPVGWLLRDRWDNIEALAGYGGPVEIIAAAHDDVIPVEHARSLAQAMPHAIYREYPCGHNDWSGLAEIEIRM